MSGGGSPSSSQSNQPQQGSNDPKQREKTPQAPGQKPEEQDRLLEALAATPLARPERVERMRRQGGRDHRKSVAYREALESLKDIP